jgi:hypothetical protein
MHHRREVQPVADRRADVREGNAIATKPGTGPGALQEK